MSDKLRGGECDSNNAESMVILCTTNCYKLVDAISEKFRTLNVLKSSNKAVTHKLALFANAYEEIPGSLFCCNTFLARKSFGTKLLYYFISICNNNNSTYS